MIRARKLGHQHKLTVPTARKGMGLAQAGRQVAQAKSLPVGTASNPGASYSPYEGTGDMYGSGGTIHIKKANRGKFNATKARTGKSTEELTHSSNAATRKRAIFAINARKWHHHAEGGWLEQYADGGIAAARKRPGGSNAGKYKGVHSFAGPSGGAPKGSYPINSIQRGKSALKLAHNAPNPAGIKAAVYRKYPSLKHAVGGYTGRGLDYNGLADQFHNTYAEGGRMLNPNLAGVGMGNVYKGIEQFPPEYGLGGVMQAFAPFLSLIPGVGPIASGIVSGVGGQMEAGDKQKQQEDLLLQQRRQQSVQSERNSQSNMQGNANPTFSWGGRLPDNEPNSFSPSGLTLGGLPGYGRMSEPNRDPGKGFDWTINRPGRAGEIKNWSRDTNTNVHKHTYADGGPIKTGDEVYNNKWTPQTRTGIYPYLNQRGVLGDTVSQAQWNQLTPDQTLQYMQNDKGLDYTKGNTANPGGIKYWEMDRIPAVNGKSIRTGKFSQNYWDEKSNTKYPFGGNTDPITSMGQPVELEKQEVYQTPQGDMGQVNGPSHAQGGVDVNLPEDSFIWSDRLKTKTGKTFADEAARLGRMRAKYAKILNIK
jgi:hypothetical protein